MRIINGGRKDVDDPKPEVDPKYKDQPMLKDLLHGLAAIEGCRVVHVGKLNSPHTLTQTHLSVVEDKD